VRDRLGWRPRFRGRYGSRLPWQRRSSGVPGPASGDTWAWVEPFPGSFTGPPSPSMSLTFIAALQRLPPDERAALVLSDVLDFGPAEVAEILECAPPEVARLLSRARSAVAGTLPRPADPPAAPGATRPAASDEDAVLARFTAAFDRGDVQGITALLAEDALLRMRPLPVQYRGRGAAGHFLAAVAFPGGTTRYRLVVTRANDQPAFGCYLRDPAAGVDRACGLVVLTLDGGHITAIDRFVDNSALPRFGLPRTLPPTPPP
jgi:hypothetical protein